MAVGLSLRAISAAFWGMLPPACGISYTFAHTLMHKWVAQLLQHAGCALPWQQVLLLFAPLQSFCCPAQVRSAWCRYRVQLK